jgi:hypothetical protein
MRGAGHSRVQWQPTINTKEGRLMTVLRLLLNTENYPGLLAVSSTRPSNLSLRMPRLMRTSNRTKANIYLFRSQLFDPANTHKSPVLKRPSNEPTADHDVRTAFGIVSFEHS